MDANVIVCHLIADPPTMAEQAKKLFALAENGDIQLCVPLIALAEVVWVLESVYKQSRATIASELIAFVAADGLSVEAADEATLALSLYRDWNIDFADALIAARCLLVGPATVYSFDRHFDRIPGIVRRTPGNV